MSSVRASRERTTSNRQIVCGAIAAAFQPAARLTCDTLPEGGIEMPPEMTMTVLDHALVTGDPGRLAGEQVASAIFLERFPVGGEEVFRDGY
jgi:hypothetical protein